MLATYASGEVRDVTRETFLDSANTEIATTSRSGVITAVRRGEAPILGRFEGNYASTTLTVMGDRSGFVWTDPPSLRQGRRSGRRQVEAHEDPSIRPLFRRRVHPPRLSRPDRLATDVRGGRQVHWPIRAIAGPSAPLLVDRLIGSPDFVEYWTNKWADLLQVNRKFLGVEGAVAYRNWIRAQIAANTPYDKFVQAILTATGSNRQNPAASYFKILRDPATTMETTTQLFLAVRFNCNKCHDHPFERWTQDQYYQTAAYFAQVGLNADSESKGRTIGGTDVEAPKPLFEIVADTGKGEMVHDRTKKVAAPVFPFPCAHRNAAAGAPRRLELSAWLTSKDNPYFARSYVNRLWGYLFGAGLIEPLDDIRAGNPPSNPELLDYLTNEFIKSGFDVRHVMRRDLHVADLPVSRSRRPNGTPMIRSTTRTRWPGGCPLKCCWMPSIALPGRSRRSPAWHPELERRRYPTWGSSYPAASWRRSADLRARVPANASAQAACSLDRSWLWSAARLWLTPSPTQPTS